MAAFLKVAFNLPLDGSYTYANLENAENLLGKRVACPFGKRELIGFVVADIAAPDIDLATIKPIKRVVDKEILFNEATIKLAQWMAGLYFCSFGEALSAMLPSGKREIELAAIELDDFSIGEHALHLSVEQENALATITHVHSGIFYLYGLTGTGKTEVFLQAAEHTLAEGRGVIYLVPEIALTGQVVEAAQRRFGKSCAIIHSHLSPSQKLLEWRRILRGEASVVIGARSAIFAPLPKLGLIVIDEEHESSYKAGNTPRYHARQIALKRRSLEGARLVMGSATPSLEAWQLMQENKIQKLSLTKRLAGGAPPSIEVIDMNGESNTISNQLATAIRDTLHKKDQVILFLNRRGFSYFFVCYSCKAELKCTQCSVSLTYHKQKNILMCHYCGYRRPAPKSCPSCNSFDIGYAGFGTEQVEEEAMRLFPEARIARLDADSTSKKGELQKILKDFRDGNIDILLGTQMVAKGLNFPRVKLVGVVLADTTLNIPDFRSAERTFALILQVAGRAGRFSPDGRVLVQTFRPSNEVILHAQQSDLHGFYAYEVTQRNMQSFPPSRRIIRVIFRAKLARKVIDAAQSFAHSLAPLLPSTSEILGPCECPISLIAGTVRWHLIVRASDLKEIHSPVAQVLAQFASISGVRIEVDVDPVGMM